MKTIGLYVHIPFCKKKCLYCDFPSFDCMEEKYEAYALALEQEIETRGKICREYTVNTIFFGGGTPTVFTEKQLERIIKKIMNSFSVAPNAEITIEANPGTLNAKKANALVQMGFNRLSMGVQAWQNSLLSTLGRIHTIEEFLENYKNARDAGFENINVDLMFALPTQTFSDWAETLKRVTELTPEHISAYSLIIEEGTPFYEKFEKGELLEIDEALDREMYHYAVDFLAKQGYHQYEISNFAKVGLESRHNKVYWQTKPYLGLGLGAHSFFAGSRFHNPYELDKYILAHGEMTILEEEKEIVTLKDAMEEFMFLGLRMTDGVSFVEFRERFGEEMKETYFDAIYDSMEEGLLYQTDDKIALTQKGLDLSNQVFSRFLL